MAASFSKKMYYGNPETLKQINVNVLTGRPTAEVDAMIATYNNLVKPVLEGHLYAIFTEWPVENNDDLTAISTIWHMMMTIRIQKSMFSTSSTGQQSAYGADVLAELDLLLNDIKSGRVIIPGAVRHSSQPSWSSAVSAPHWTQTPVENSKEVSSVFPRGLRP